MFGIILNMFKLQQSVHTLIINVFLPNWAKRDAFFSGMAGRGAEPKQWLKIAASCCMMASFWRTEQKEGILSQILKQYGKTNKKKHDSLVCV